MTAVNLRYRAVASHWLLPIPGANVEEVTVSMGRNTSDTIVSNVTKNFSFPRCIEFRSMEQKVEHSRTCNFFVIVGILSCFSSVEKVEQSAFLIRLVPLGKESHPCSNVLSFESALRADYL